MPNLKDAATSAAYERILVAGRGGSGKTAQIWTLPGRKFAYLFDPAARKTLSGLDIDVEEFLPEAGDMNAALKGFNKDSKTDIIHGPKGPNKEPRVYVNWVEDFNKRLQENFFANYDWFILDSYTLFQNAVMDRNLYLNNRFGQIEDLSDYRVVGSKLADISRNIFSLPINIYATSHLNTFQDEKTKRLETQINLSGKGRTMIPLLCNNIWELRSSSDDKAARVMLTKPEPRGFPDIRTSIKNLKAVEDIEIKDWNHPENYGIGAILKKSGGLIYNSKKPKSDTAAVKSDAPAAMPSSIVASGTTQSKTP